MYYFNVRKKFIHALYIISDAWFLLHRLALVESRPAFPKRATETPDDELETKASCRCHCSRAKSLNGRNSTFGRVACKGMMRL